MRSPRLVLLCMALALLVSSRALGDQITVSDVPSYIWYRGCGPTAAGMIMGFWDAHGYPNLITGAVNDMIASPEHIYDYWGWGDGKDRVPPPAFHDDNCVADFMRASRGSILKDGESYENLQYIGMVNYANYCGYPYADGFYAYFGGLWDIFVAEIDAGRPMEFLVDKNGDNISDHFVTAIGYDNDNPDALQYACYDTYDNNVHWYAFAGKANGQLYGIQSGSWFDPIPEPATLVLLALGCAGLAAGRARKRSTSSAAR